MNLGIEWRAIQYIGFYGSCLIIGKVDACAIKYVFVCAIKNLDVVIISGEESDVIIISICIDVTKDDVL